MRRSYKRRMVGRGRTCGGSWACRDTCSGIISFRDELECGGWEPQSLPEDGNLPRG